jgi:hypothetical protein
MRWIPKIILLLAALFFDAVAFADFALKLLKKRALDHKGLV